MKDGGECQRTKEQRKTINGEPIEIKDGVNK